MSLETNSGVLLGSFIWHCAPDAPTDSSLLQEVAQSRPRLTSTPPPALECLVWPPLSWLQQQPLDRSPGLPCCQRSLRPPPPVCSTHGSQRFPFQIPLMSPSSCPPSDKFPFCFMFLNRAQPSPWLRKPYGISLELPFISYPLLPFIAVVNHTDHTWQNPSCFRLSVCFSLCLECSLHLYASYSLTHLHQSLVMSFKWSSLATLPNTLSSPHLTLSPLSLLFSS